MLRQIIFCELRGGYHDHENQCIVTGMALYRASLLLALSLILGNRGY